MKTTLNDSFTHEYGVDLVRLENVFKQVNKPFELAYFHIHSGQQTTKHNHLEREIFVCLAGYGKAYVDEKEIDVSPNDTWFVESGQNHTILNDKDELMTLFSVWWYP